MKYGIYNLINVPVHEWIVKCNWCGNYYYEEIGFELNTNSLKIFKDEAGFFKGCPQCKTDKYLMNVGFLER